MKGREIIWALFLFCDWHHICAYSHDWVGLGNRPWPEKTHPIYDLNKPTTINHPRCKLGDPRWKNDCK